MSSTTALSSCWQSVWKHTHTLIDSMRPGGVRTSAAAVTEMQDFCTFSDTVLLNKIKIYIRANFNFFFFRSFAVI